MFWKQAQEVFELITGVINISLNSHAISLYRELLYIAQQSQKNTENSSEPYSGLEYETELDPMF